MTKNLSELEKFAEMSVKVGCRTEYVQGGGGNTSYKTGDGIMAVKASGYRLDDITASAGYVLLDYKATAGFYEKYGDRDVDREKESLAAVMSAVKPQEGVKPLRPSVEAGFHALLDTAVIHTHSVYANILCCSLEGREHISRIFGNMDISCAYIPYTDPGYQLTVAIKDTNNEMLHAKGKIPQVIFMENHGLIVNAADSDACLALHDKVNEAIKAYFKINENFPEIRLEEDGAGFKSASPFVLDFFSRKKPDREYIESRILYPDQIVYLNNNQNAIMKSDGMLYECGRSAAVTAEETLAAYLYVLDNVDRLDLTLRTMPEKGIAFIRGWESEKYRKQVADK